MSIVLLFAFSFFQAFHLSPTKEATTIEIAVSGLQVGKGTLNIALFPTSGSFPDLSEDTYTARIPVTNSTMTYRFSDLPYGDYAVALYQDVNDNGEMDSNMWGIPKEPYGFSNGAIAKWGTPAFEEAAVDVNTPNAKWELVVKNWKDW